MIGSSLEPSLRDSSLGSSVLFFGHAAIFILLLFLLKTDVLFCIIFSRRSSHLTISFMCFNNFNKTYRDWKYMPSLSRFINHLYCWIYSSYILYKKWNKTLRETDWPFASFWDLKAIHFTYSHFFSFVVPLAVIRCHSLSFAVSFYHLL